MKLLEFTRPDIATGFYDPAEDRMERRVPSDTRKPVITLRKINRLKKMRALKTLERIKRQDVLAVMYGQPVETAPSGF